MTKRIETIDELEFSLHEHDLERSRNGLEGTPYPDKSDLTEEPISFFKTPNDGVKCLIAFLSLQNVTLRGQVRTLKKKLAFSEISKPSRICVNTGELEETRRNLVFYQQKCLDLELEVSKLKNRIERMEKSTQVHKKKVSNKENLSYNSNRLSIKMSSRHQSIQRSKSKNGRGSSSKSYRSNTAKRRQLSMSRRKGNESLKVSANEGTNLNGKFEVEFDKVKFQRKFKEAEYKAISIMQFLDNSRLTEIGNLENWENMGDRQRVNSSRYMLKELVLTKWRLMAGFPTKNPESFTNESSLLPLLKNPISSQIWKLSNTKNKPCSQLRYNKGYLQYERKLLDFEKEIFFKKKFRILMKSIVRRTQRQLKLIKVIAFYKLIACSVFIDKEDLGVIGQSKYAGRVQPFETLGGQLREKILSSGGMEKDESFLVNNSFFLLGRKPENQNFPMNMLETNELKQANLKWIESAHNMEMLPNDLDYIEMGNDLGSATKLKFGKNFKKRENKSILKTKHRLLQEERRKALMTRIVYRLYLRTLKRKRNGFCKWFKQSMKAQISDLLVEIENMNIVLSERAFREKVFRTKIKLLQGQIATQIDYFQKLMAEDAADRQRC